MKPSMIIGNRKHFLKLFLFEKKKEIGLWDTHQGKAGSCK